MLLSFRSALLSFSGWAVNSSPQPEKGARSKELNGIDGSMPLEAISFFPRTALRHVFNPPILRGYVWVASRGAKTASPDGGPCLLLDRPTCGILRRFRALCTRPRCPSGRRAHGRGFGFSWLRPLQEPGVAGGLERPRQNPIGPCAMSSITVQGAGCIIDADFTHRPGDCKFDFSGTDQPC